MARKPTSAFFKKNSIQYTNSIYRKGKSLHCRRPGARAITGVGTGQSDLQLYAMFQGSSLSKFGVCGKSETVAKNAIL